MQTLLTRYLIISIEKQDPVPRVIGNYHGKEAYSYWNELILNHLQKDPYVVEDKHGTFHTISGRELTHPMLPKSRNELQLMTAYYDYMGEYYLVKLELC